MAIGRVPITLAVAVVTQVVLHANTDDKPVDLGSAALRIAQQPAVAEKVFGDSNIINQRRIAMAAKHLLESIGVALLFLHTPPHRERVAEREHIGGLSVTQI